MRPNEREVLKLCGSLFNKRELRYFIASLGSAQERLEHTISWDAPFDQICYEVAVALENRRLIDTRFFRELLLARPAASLEIGEAARRLGVGSLELSFGGRAKASRAEYRSCSWKQFCYGNMWMASQWSSGRNTRVVNVVSMPFTALGFAFCVNDAMGLPPFLSGVVGCVLTALFWWLIHRKLQGIIRRLWRQSGIRETNVEVLVCAQVGLEIRSPSRASITPYSLVKVTRGGLGWHLELGAASFEFFPHLNAMGAPDATDTFWSELRRRCEVHRGGTGRAWTPGA